MRSKSVLALVALLETIHPSSPSARLRVDVLRSSGALPAHIAGMFQMPLAFQQADTGQYFIFDRRAHAVYTIVDDAPKKVVEIGAEAGRILDPSAFDIDPKDGTFVVADAPGMQERIQTFTASGGQIGGFTLPGREVPRITLDTMVLNGIGSMQFTGRTLLLNQPERGALISELAIDGTPARTFGYLRPTGHESDPNLHLAFNVGLPLIDPAGGFYFVFQTGIPLFRRYDAKGQLMFERHVEGPEIDEYLRGMPTAWPQRHTPQGDLVPIVPPVIRTAGVDRQGRLWISLMQPYTYVYDASGDKVRTVQFKGADIIAPNSLFFTKDGRALVTPGCYEFKVAQ